VCIPSWQYLQAFRGYGANHDEIETIGVDTPPLIMAMPVEPCCLTWRILVGIALAHDLQGASVYVLSAGQGAHCGKKN